MSIEPFLKWPGGKRWLADILVDDLKSLSGKYIEPFLGGAALFFCMRPSIGLLGDVNQRLIEVYQKVHECPSDISKGLKEYHEKHNKDFYYKERDRTYSDPVKRACQFLYLNRTCFNGIYRVNLLGKFNVPIGDKKNVVLPSDNFEAASQALGRVEIVCQDFGSTIDQSVDGDIVYADPPYTVKHNNNGFVKYNEKLFLWDDQVRLKNKLEEARERGVHVVVSNAHHDSIIDLYKNKWNLYSVVRSSVISANAQGRGKTTELIISSFRLVEAEGTGCLSLINTNGKDFGATSSAALMAAS